MGLNLPKNRNLSFPTQLNGMSNLIINGNIFQIINNNINNTYYFGYQTALLPCTVVDIPSLVINSNSFIENSNIYDVNTPLIDVNEKSNGMSPLMYAARYNKTDIIKILILSGANINDKDKHGLTALKYAELSNSNESVVLLKQYK